ncbi:CheY-like superfamily [Thamnocephalis sphaerospora]|uniref:Stress response regulator protein 1 n=1 Tax=Thamnocephalis sphaerospora TaxID=78915 RepID=A0A4P9XLW3_9FUNG|nr:CheY-like superfamily [Thamnocephalis sphaerospora]|eukprot:RKP06816.1 CheY-like superfamily [Thamnocephalis sphaerospora]
MESAAKISPFMQDGVVPPTPMVCPPLTEVVPRQLPLKLPDGDGMRRVRPMPQRIPSLSVPPKPKRERASSFQHAPLALCCDDNPINLRLLLRRLESVGFECLAATSGEEALERAQQLYRSDTGRSLSLVMMDFHLPGIDGIETVIQLRQIDWRRDPLYVLNTADTSQDLKTRAARADIWEYLSKPFPVDVLREYYERVRTEREATGDESDDLQQDEQVNDADADSDSAPLMPDSSMMLAPMAEES